MKKLLLLLSIVATVVACKNNDNITNNNATTIPKPASVGGWPRSITLNGVDSAYANRMIIHFDTSKKKDKRPWRQSVWFDINTIQLIVKLLNKEIVKEKMNLPPNTADTTDGIRIYYTSDPAIKSVRLSNSIVLVSTKFGGYKADAPSKGIHRDYYRHSEDLLFKDTNSIRGKVSHKGLLKGELTYDFCLRNCNTPACDNNTLHYITRRQAHLMVKNFGKRRAIVTTSEWFELGLFKAFADSKKIDGLRIYFARRPKEVNSPRTSEKDAFILVPTVAKKYLGRPVHEDYFDCEITEKYFSQFMTKTNWTRHPYTGGGQDNGELCRDNCDK